MFIHQHTCISPQQTNGSIDLDTIHPSVDGKLIAIEPILEGVPPSMLRRMSKAVRMGIGTGLPLLKSNPADGIIIGTANGGMEDCIKFLNQIVEYDEGLLTPANFVQSTPNAIAGQLSLITKNQNYNATHVHQGLAFENAVLDAKMLITEHPEKSYLLGGLDEISSYNYNIDYLGGWYDKTKTSETLYSSGTPATIAGEGAAMFIVNGREENALCKVATIEIFHSNDVGVVTNRVKHFIESFLPVAENTIFLSGENGDSRQLPAYILCEHYLGSAMPIVRFKHITGEYPTASAFALWLASIAIEKQLLPNHFYKTEHCPTQIDRVVIYNQYQGKQHSLMLIEKK